jgi:hypothetical protein
MVNSSDVVAGQDATATQHNNLRADVVSNTTGHRHSGAANAGAALFGTPVTRTVNTVYTPDTDVLVMVVATPNDVDGYIRGKMDSANPPTTIVAGMGYETTDTDYISIMFACPKGYRYKVESSGVASLLITEVGIGA